MEVDRNKLRLQHILECIQKIEIIRGELSYATYTSDWKSQDVIIRNLEVIGEAARHIDEDIILKYPEVAWRDVRGMRNFLIHAYFQVDLDEVWKTASNDISVLKDQIIKIISDLQK
jgi:uncharacterized protein with HEPN domain